MVQVFPKRRRKLLLLVKKLKVPASKQANSCSDKPAKSSNDNRSAKSSSGTKIDSLDQKWSERFNQLETLQIARSLEKPQELTFQTIKVTLRHTPPVGSIKPTNAFIKPVNQPPSATQPTDRPTDPDQTVSEKQTY